MISIGPIASYLVEKFMKLKSRDKMNLCYFTCGATPTGAVRGTPNLLVVDIPLVESRSVVNATTIRNTLFDACINATVPMFGRLLVEAVGIPE